MNKEICKRCFKDWAYKKDYKRLELFEIHWNKYKNIFCPHKKTPFIAPPIDGDIPEECIHYAEHLILNQ